MSQCCVVRDYVFAVRQTANIFTLTPENADSRRCTARRSHSQSRRATTLPCFLTARLAACWCTTMVRFSAVLRSTEEEPSVSDESLIALCESAHFFLKHRKNGEKPHKRFVFTRDNSVFWSARADGGGKLGRLDGPGLMVVPGAATVTFEAKLRKLGATKRNCIFSIVGPSRSLDLEAESEAARHQWVRAFNAFVKRKAALRYTADDELSSKAASTILGPMVRTTSTLGVAVGAALGTSAGHDAEALDEALETASAVFAQLSLSEQSASTSSAGATSSVCFPKLASSLAVLTGSRPGRWVQWEMELADGEIA